jgi:tetratricopeptide (TPR) repeat protein
MSFLRLVVAALLCAFVALAGYATLLAQQPPRNASLVPGVEKPEDIAAALQKLTPDEVTALMARERAALTAEPLETAALFNIGTLYKLQGQTEKSEDIYLRASARSLRDFTPQLAALDILLRRKDFDGAMLRLDGLMQSNVKRRPELFTTFETLLANEESSPAAIKTLARNPDWRKEYFEYRTQQNPRVATTFKLVSALRNAKAGLNDDELRMVIGQLAAKGDFESAQIIWLDQLDAQSLAKTGPIYDGSVETPVRNMVFDWNLTPVRNGKIRVVSKSAGSSERALQVSLSNVIDYFNNVYQFLRLTPGSYKLGYEVRADDIKTSGGLVWRVYCAGSKEAIATGPAISASGPWTKTGFAFTVPESGCTTQLLRLESLRNIVLDLKMSGRVAYDGITITQ